MNIPRPEYPRPDFQRGTIEGLDWLNLNGPWQFRFDADNRGREERWFQPDDLEWREQIIVPFCWESLAAWGEGDAAGNENYYSTRVFRNPLEVTRYNHRSAARYETGWYRRKVEIPAGPAWEGKRVILIVGAADFFTDCWCEGSHLGRHDGGYLPFEFDLTDSLRSLAGGRREGTVVFRVEDPRDNQEQPVGKQWRWYTTTSGIWQTVYIEPRSATRVEAFRITSEPETGVVHFHVECLNAAAKDTLRIEFASPAGETFKLTAALRNGAAEAEARIEKPMLWNPNHPHLYRTRLAVEREGETLDLVRTYFGIRKIDSAPAEDPKAPAVLRLNGVARYLRGALYQSYFPEGVYTAGDAQRLKNDILCAKQFGFNFLRIHIKIDDPLLLYYADSLGIMLMADFPNFGEGGDTALGRQRFEEMMRRAIRRDFNHPSIVAWCLFNETWGFGGQVELVELFKNPPIGKNSPTRETLKAVAQAEGGPVPVPPEKKAKLANLSSLQWVQRMWELAKKLDSTRLIEDMSVVHWEHLDYFAHGDTDINSWHFYINDYAKAKEHIAKIVQSTFTGSSFNYAEGYAQRGQPLINSEYGGIGALDGDRDVSWSFKFLTNEMRRHGQISAYIYTELHDVEWEFNGFLNYDRTLKHFGYDPAIINESDVLPIDAAPVSRARLGEQIEVDVYSSHFATGRETNVTLQWRLDGMDTRGRVYAGLAKGSAAIEFPHHRVALARKIALDLPSTTMLCTLRVEAFCEDGERVASNFVHYFVADGYPPVREETARVLYLRGHPGEWSECEWSGGAPERELNRAQDACGGFGHGHVAWDLPLAGADLRKARRIRVLCEASSRRADSPQTDDDAYASALRIRLNGVPVHESPLLNHPHDSRGVLSYLRGGRGAHGYLAHATAEGDLLARIADAGGEGHLRLRCEVPGDALATGGLTIYGAECGRYPVCPTVAIEW